MTNPSRAIDTAAVSPGAEEEANLALVRLYLAAVADPTVSWSELATLLDPEVEQHELPNALVPQGICRKLGALQTAHARGAQAMTDQRYEIKSMMVEGNRVAVEIDWSGTLRAPFGKLVPGDVMRAHIAAFIEVRAGRIAAQRNYDCYEPW